MIDLGRRPPRTTDDPVVWHKRAWNTTADYLVNHTMDEQRSWYQIFAQPNEQCDLALTNLVLHLEGGTRIGRCLAAAWYLEAVTCRNGIEHIVPLAMSGTFLSDPISSFTAEAIALDEGCAYIYAVIQRCSSFHF